MTEAPRDARGDASPLRTLAHDPVLRRAGAALALYRLAEFGPWVAMLVYAYDQGGATATGVVSLALLVPTALFAPFAGPLIDRYGASTVLVGGYAAQAVAMAATAAALLADAPPLLVYACGALTATVLTFTHPAHAVVSPGIARTTDQLVALNAVTGWILSVGLVAAPALAGVVLGLGSAGYVYAGGAACLAVAALLVFPLRRLVPPLGDMQERSTVLGELRDGVRGLASQPPAREVTLVLAATFVMVGALDVLVVVLAVGQLDIGGSGAGYLTALHGAGAVVGAAASLTLVGRSRLVPVLLASAVCGGVAFVVLGLNTTLVTAVVVVAITGVARSLLEVSSATLLQRVTPTALLARVFALKEGLTMAAWGLGSALVPILIWVGGVELALIGSGAIVPLVVAVRYRALLRVDALATVPVVAIALLRSLPIFRHLPVPAIEGVAQHAGMISRAAGEPIVVQGEPGSSYYAIVDGSVDITRDGRHVATIGRGEGFGEIALLHGGTRTATATAQTDTSLLVVEHEPFLVAVTGHGESADRAQEIAAARVASYGA